jgi:molybdopterin molybdotransferase
MLSVAAVWERLDALAAPLPAERVPLAAAAGRVLREPVTAPEDQPSFDRAAIDGYVAALEVPAGAAVRLVGDIPMGDLAPASPPPGAAFRLFTGSAVPAGPVGLVMHEDTTADPAAGTVTLRVAPSAAFIRRRASQARAGDLLLAPGATLQAGGLALLASVGVVTPLVARRARVAHLVTGGELIAPEAPAQPGRIRDSNSTLVSALLAQTSAELVAHARAGEGYEATAAAFTGLLDAAPDLVLVSGGSSGGAHDHTARLLVAHGFTLVVEQVASRPGKPLLVGVRGAQIAFGLPGNPLSHFVCFHLFVARVLARLAGASPAPLLRLALAPGAALRPHPRETWWPAARVAEGYSPLPWADSSDLTALVRTHALLRVPSAVAPESSADGLLV